MMLKKMIFLFCSMLLTGCWAIPPRIENPAPENELKKVVAIFEKTNNPAKRTCRTYRLSMTAAVENTSIRIQSVVCGDVPNRRFRSTTTAPGIPAQVELYDGKAGYSIIPGLQSKAISGKKLAFLRYTARTTPWSSLEESYEQIQLDPVRHTINGKSCYRLVARPKGEPELDPVELFIDEKTNLLVQSRTVIYSSMGQIPSTTNFVTYRKEKDGTPIPQDLRIQQLNMTIHGKLQKIEFDCTFPDHFFDAESIENDEE